jgi:predicted nucleotidyltransferase/uncharacterized protein YfkK (UPF0435 family)
MPKKEVKQEEQQEQEKEKQEEVKYTPKELKKIIQEISEPLTKLKGIVGVFIYGSSVTKGVIPGHDVDYLVIFDDLLEKPEIEKINFYLEFIKLRASRKEILLHVQPLKPLSLWWKLIARAEPWAISAIRRSIIIYDPNDFLTLTKRLIEEGKLYSIDEKMERMMARAIESLMGVREKLLKVPYMLLQCLTIAGQMMLSYLGIYTTSANETRNMLIKHKEKLKLSNSFIEDYTELIRINEKIMKGTLSEFRPSEIDAWIEKIRRHIKDTEEVLIRCENEMKVKETEEIYNEVMKLCEDMLMLKAKKIPPQDKAKIELFKLLFVETKLIDKSYYDALTELYSCVKQKKSVVFDKVYLRAFRAALEEIAYREKMAKPQVKG